MIRSKSSRSNGYMYYRHTLPVRVMHWINVIVLTILLLSGFGIFNAYPALNWGKSSYTGVPPLMEIQVMKGKEITGVTRIFGHDFNTTGFLGVSRSPEGKLVIRGFPTWLTIPGIRWLSMSRYWHFFFAWLLVINGIAYVGYSIFCGHLKRDIFPNGRDLRSIGKSIVDHLLFRRPRGEAAKHYNVLQKSAYLAVIFLLLPLVIVNGLGMSPMLNALPTGWVDLFGGRQSVRTIHFLVAWALVAFTVIHVFQVLVNGFWNNLRSMITGRYRITSGGKHE
jgi:thiosulfate reductase cytochrome b subunit